MEVRPIRATFKAVAVAVAVALLLSGCFSSGPQKTGDSFVSGATAALEATPGVLTGKVRYTDPGGMGAVINVRVTTDPAAELETVLADSLRAVAGAAGSLKPVSKVDVYVFTEGDEENGIRPDVLGLPQSPTVEEIRQYAASGTAG